MEVLGNTIFLEKENTKIACKCCSKEKVQASRYSRGPKGRNYCKSKREIIILFVHVH